jgi:hypothetical protein
MNVQYVLRATVQKLNPIPNYANLALLYDIL